MNKLSIEKNLNGTRRLRTLSNKTLSEEVSERLIKHIINGNYPAGTKLPPEREMAEAFGVARHIVREALKRLETLRLIKIRQGSGIVVEDYTLTGGIELVDYLMVKDDGNVDKNFLKSILEFHTFISIHTLKLATMCITKKELKELRRLVNERSENLDDFEKRSDLTIRISDLVVKASRNLYIMLLFNSLIRTTTSFEQIFGIPLPEKIDVQNYLERGVEAMERKDPEAVGQAAAEAFEKNYQYMTEKMGDSHLVEKIRNKKTRG